MWAIQVVVPKVEGVVVEVVGRIAVVGDLGVLEAGVF